MDFAYLSRCKRRSCQGIQTIPTHLMYTKTRELYYIHRCPRCHKLYKSQISALELSSAIEWAGKYFAHCDVCGADNSNNWQPGNSNSMFKERVRIDFFCKTCGKHRAKIATNEIMTHIIRRLKTGKDKMTLKVHQVQCNSCGEIIEENSRFCDTCGVKLSAY